MLVLTRKPAETINIGNDIVIKVIKTARGTVKLGIEAPEDVRIVRGELTETPVATASPQVVDPGSVQPQHLEVLSDQYPHVA